MDKKKISLVILSVVLISSILTVFLLPKTAKTPTKIPAPANRTAPTQISEKLCNQFRLVKADIKCEDAFNRALAIAPGQITNISIGNKKMADLTLSPPKRVSKDFWFVDIQLTKPYFDEYIKKTINKLRLGIPFEDLKDVVYKEALE